MTCKHGLESAWRACVDCQIDAAMENGVRIGIERAASLVEAAIRATPRASVEAGIAASMMQDVANAVRSLAAPAPAYCGECGGTGRVGVYWPGAVAPATFKPCPKCNGTGKQP